MARLAIDSHPLGTGILTSTDYSGLQLFGLGALAIQERLEGVKVSEGDQVFTAHLRNDGRKRITGIMLSKMFAHGLSLLLKRAPMLRATVFRNLASIGTRPDILQLRLSAPIKGFAEVFRLPNWVAAFEGKPYPEKKLTQTADTQWIVSDAAERACHEVRIVGTPKENLTLALNESLDFTADTCVDFAQIDETYTTIDTGLHAHLVPLCDEAKFRAVIDDLRDFSLRLVELRLVEPAFRNRRLSPKNYLVISYDDFHPNPQICTRVARHLESKGWSVRLLHDDYYRPIRPGDCKLIIKRPHVNAPLFRAYSILGFSRTRAHANVLAPAIQKAEAGERVEWIELLQQNLLSRPIVAIPSIFRAKTPGAINPLIRNLMPLTETHTI